MGEGFAALPWALLAIRHIGDDGRWRWAVLLGVATAVLVLAGSPEAIVDVGALAATYAVVRFSLRPGAWWAFVSRGAVAAALGIGLSAVVWLPALHFIATSQRAHLSASFASEYSYPPSAILLSVIPFLEGGSRLFSQPQYFGPSNLPEVALYVGILPLVAALTMLARPWRSWPPDGERRTWYVVLVVGLVLAIGAGTPLEHLLVHIPFYGRQRDQGRNIVAADLAACALFAWWIDAGGRTVAAKLVAAARNNGAGNGERDRTVRGRHRSEVAVALGLVGVVIVFAAWFALAPTSLWHTLDAYRPFAGHGSYAVACGGPRGRNRRLGRSRRLVALAARVLALGAPRCRVHAGRSRAVLLRIELCLLRGIPEPDKLGGTAAAHRQEPFERWSLRGLRPGPVRPPLAGRCR